MIVVQRVNKQRAQGELNAKRNAKPQITNKNEDVCFHVYLCFLLSLCVRCRISASFFGLPMSCFFFCLYDHCLCHHCHYAWLNKNEIKQWLTTNIRRRFCLVVTTCFFLSFWLFVLEILALHATHLRCYLLKQICHIVWLCCDWLRRWANDERAFIVK